jgi:DNA-binding HxlR family transcriptional regulator
MLNSTNADIRSAALALDLLQGKWRVQILGVMRTGPVRLGELGRLIPSASKKALVDNLRDMESIGLIARKDLGGRVRHVEYDILESIRAETCLILEQLNHWGALFAIAKFEEPVHQ